MIVVLANRVMTEIKDMGVEKVICAAVICWCRQTCVRLWIGAWGVALLLFLLVLVESANASTYKWTGEAAKGSGWSAGGNWAGDLVPSAPGPVSLEFPRLSACAGVCYESKNDISGLSVESLMIDDGDEYTLSGDEITLGVGGLAATPEFGTTGAAGDILELPVKLGATQTWNIEQRSGEPTGENGVALTGDVTGPTHDLKIDLHNGPVGIVEDKIETERLAIEGVNSGEASGIVDMLGAELNAAGTPIELSHTFLLGFGALGALKTNRTGIGVGISEKPALGIEASSAALDSGSEVEFLIAGPGSESWEDYSQLYSEGPVALDGAKLYVYVYPPTKSGACPVPAVGQTYTFVETTGALTGAFGNASEGSEIPIGYAKACGSEPTRYLRIAYHESGTGQTMTGTVTEAHGEGASSGPPPLAPRPVTTVGVVPVANTTPVTTTVTSHGGIELLGGAMLRVARGHAVSVKLDCAANETCTGKLVLTVRTTASKARVGRKGARTVTVGTVLFSIAAGKTVAVKITLDAAGRRMLKSDHGRLDAHVAIEDAVPGVVR